MKKRTHPNVWRALTGTAFVLALSLLVTVPATPADAFTITTSVAGGKGKIKPSSATVSAGKSKTLKVKPAKGYHVAEIMVNESSVVYDKDSALVAGGVSVKKKLLKYTLSNMSADAAVSVTFEPNRNFDLTVSVVGAGTVKVRGGGPKKCGPGPDTCSGTVAEDKTAKLKAKAAKGYVFAGWSGGTSGFDGKLKLKMTSDKAITATFVSESAAATALKISDKISVVDAKAGTNGGMQAYVAAPDVPPDSDYATDETFVFVEERSVEAFETINEILCMAAQTKYDAMLNQGPYKALVDQSQCESDKDDGSSQDGSGSQNGQSGSSSSSSSRPEYMQWVVESSRANNAAPQIVKAWILEESDDPWDPSKRINAKITITESASASNPYGIFSMDFESWPYGDFGGGDPGALLAADELDEPLFYGFMKTERDASGDVLLKFISQSASWMPGGFSEKATLNKNSSGGRGTTTTREFFGSEVEEATYDIAFTDSHFLRDNGEEQLCLDRENFDETAWRYGLYDSTTGARINPASGFPVVVTQNDQTYYGWIGYWGLWFPDEVELSNGDTVYKQEFHDNGPDSQGTPYELFVAQGKLRKHTKTTTTLGAIKNLPLDYWDDLNFKNYRIIWNGSQFTKVALFDEQQGMWSDLDTPEVLDLSSLPYDTMFLWSHALGGNVRVKLACTESSSQEGIAFACSASDSSNVVLYEETVIYPTDSVPATLACMSECPNGANDGTSDLYIDTDAMQYQETDPANATYVSYSFDGDTMLLMNGSTSIIQTTENENYPWGIWSGPLFDPTSANLAKLACDWDESGNSTCGWQAWEKLDEYYTWESGPEDWNQLSAIMDANGDLLRFEPPLAVRYTHQQTNPDVHDYKYDGTTFYLEYNGFGDLYGLPGRCIDFLTGEDAECGPETRWVPELTIPDGSDIEGDSATYLSKALEKEQRMRSVDPENCSHLHLVTYELPSIQNWKSPDIGEEPEVTGPPAVVGGVLQNEN